MTVNAQIIVSMRNNASPGIRQIAGDTKALTTSLGGLKSAFAALGISLGVGALVKLGKDAFDAANSLEKTEATVRALSGSTARYAQVLQTAQSGQSLYGGSLEENLRGLGSLVNLSNRASVSLGTLDNISRRLALVKPEQGIEGANFALKEFLSDDGARAALSLGTRFELPRHALAALADESVSAKDRIAGLDKLLQQQGITNAVLADRTKTTAAVYDQLGAAALNARDKVGALIAEMLKQPAIGLTNLLKTGDITNGASAGRDQAQAGTVAAAASFEDYARRVQAANAQVEAVLAKDPIGALFIRQKVTLEQLNPVQFAYAQSLIATGTASQDAVAKAQALHDVSESLAQQAQGQSAAFQALIPQMARISSLSTEDAGQVLALNAAYLQRKISIDQVRIVLGGLEAAQEAQRQKALEEQHENQRLARTFDGIVPSANAAAVAIANVAGARVNNHVNDRTIGGVAGIGGLLTSGFDAVAQRSAKADQQAAEVHQSEVQLALARAKTSAQRIAILQRELGATSDQVERNRLLAQIEGERNSGAKAHTSELNKQLSLNERIYDSVNKQRQAELDIEELQITGRQADRKAAQDDRTAQRILAKTEGRTDARALEARAVAQDIIALDDVRRRKRALELEEKGATANGQIVNGRVLQSRPGDGGRPVVPGGTGGTGASSQPPSPNSQPPASGGQQTLMLVLTDAAGAILAKLTSPIIFDDLMGAIRQGHMGVGVG